MKRVKDEDQKRLWSNEGFARFSDLLRIHDEALAEKLHVFLSELVKYTGANQGALFVAREQAANEKILELQACYAYGKKKHLSQTIHLGEGLVGQAFQEKDVIFLTDIPEDYIQITSGIGQALPNSILIVPLINNDEVVGVLELASFQVFEEYKIQFIKKLLESLAATLVSVSMNEQTKQLLADSRQQSEMMRAQEEELRQNAEEMNAAQEMMNSRNQELERRIRELETEKEQLKSNR